MRSVRARGVSLIEVLVFAIILLGLSVLLVQFLVRGSVRGRQTESYAYAQSEASKVLRVLARDVRATTAEFLQVDTNRFYFLSSSPESGEPKIEFEPATGAILWKRWVAYAFNSSRNQVVRSSVELDAPVADLTLKPEPNVGFLDFPNAQNGGQVVGNGVMAFEIEVQPGGGLLKATVETRYSGHKGQQSGTSRWDAQVSLSKSLRIPRQD